MAQDETGEAATAGTIERKASLTVKAPALVKALEKLVAEKILSDYSVLMAYKGKDGVWKLSVDDGEGLGVTVRVSA